jgi:neutral ceramidase
VNFKKAARILLYLFLSLVILAFLLITPVDWTPYQKTSHYTQTQQRLDSVAQVLAKQTQTDTVKVGWAKANITPPHPMPLTAYGQRGPYENVHDSVWVRAIVFTNQYRTIAFLAYDLWIVHPYLAEAIRDTLRQSGLPGENIYFSATHTHNGYGGWAPGLAGKLITGGYDENVVKFICAKTLEAVRTAYNNVETTKLGFGQFDASDFVRNRLIENGNVDPWLRVLKMQEVSSSTTALLCTFSAHSTFISSQEKTLATDYAGPLLQALTTTDSIDFAAYAAGAVGSHSPVKEGDFAFEKLNKYAGNLGSIISKGEDSIYIQIPQTLKYAKLPVAMRSPHIRIADNWRLRPWLFEALMGKQQPYINCLRVGDVVLLGLPCELSGEFYPRFTEICKERNIHLIITTFNGNYLGYVTPDEYYSLKKYETRDMNWYGPYNGAYFTELIKGILQVI